MHLRSPSLLRILPVLLVAGSGIVAQAQLTTGSLMITIVDRTTGDPLKDAKVVLSSPALFQNRVYKADARGQIRAQLLPVGNYSAMITQEGFRGAQLAEVRIGLGTNMAQNVDLAPLSAPGDMMTVTTIAASFDVDGGVDIDDPTGN
jgi:hypothetical protein